MLTGVRSRRTSVRDDPASLDNDAEAWQYVEPDSDEDEDNGYGESEQLASSPHGTQTLVKKQEGRRENSEKLATSAEAESSQRKLVEPERDPMVMGGNCDVSGDSDILAVAERLVTSAMADATKVEPAACTSDRFGDDGDEYAHKSQGRDDEEKESVGTGTLAGFDETEDDSDNYSDVGSDAEVQVNIIDATDEDNDSYDDHEDNGNTVNEDSDGDFEIISINDQDYVNI